MKRKLKKIKYLIMISIMDLSMATDFKGLLTTPTMLRVLPETQDILPTTS